MFFPNPSINSDALKRAGYLRRYAAFCQIAHRGDQFIGGLADFTPRPRDKAAQVVQVTALHRSAPSLPRASKPRAPFPTSRGRNRLPARGISRGFVGWCCRAQMRFQDRA